MEIQINSNGLIVKKEQDNKKLEPYAKQFIANITSGCLFGTKWPWDQAGQPPVYNEGWEVWEAGGQDKEREGKLGFLCKMKK